MADTLHFDADQVDAVESDAERVEALQLYNPNEKYIKTNDNKMEDEINIGICKSITINKKMYKNFMGIIVGDEALENLKNEPLDVDKAAEVKK